MGTLRPRLHWRSWQYLLEFVDKRERKRVDSPNMASRPVIMPDPFNGDRDWDEWIDHFEGVATVNDWSDETKLLWLRVRLIGKAQTAFKQLPTESRDTYQHCVGALRRRFEPDSKKELYLAKFQNRHKRIGEDWATFAEQLRTLSNKAYPTLGVEAKEVLALNRYLGEIEDPQISFGVKQTRPKNLDEAVATTLEMESYVKNQPGTKTVRFDEDSSTVIAGVRSTNEAMMQMMSQVMERLEKLEMNQTRSQERHYKRQSTPPSSPVICRRCGGEGHYARGCASRVKYQGNEKPSTP